MHSITLAGTTEHEQHAMKKVFYRVLAFLAWFLFPLFTIFTLYSNANLIGIKNGV